MVLCERETGNMGLMPPRPVNASNQVVTAAGEVDCEIQRFHLPATLPGRQEHPFAGVDQSFATSSVRKLRKSCDFCCIRKRKCDGDGSPCRYVRSSMESGVRVTALLCVPSVEAYNPTFWTDNCLSTIELDRCTVIRVLFGLLYCT